ncbi:hypothetical protein CHH70_04905 [Shouchella clausii]|jgi:hypothetical protein|nr:hypothetical protein CHH73_00160 [Shouchella clausii]PAE95457.1 hypothetical protein CHH70_04905 [Shouchella clausii]PAF10922.1 hypothetical protein CHH65_03455 [Shouchella clausii]
MGASDLAYMVALLGCFFAAGLFGGLALLGVMRNKRLLLYWTAPCALCSAVAFLVLIFQLV